MSAHSNRVFIGEQEHFPGIAHIPFEGLGSDNPLAFKIYNEQQLVGGKSMREHLRFAVCYWHSFCGSGADPFGPGTRVQSWQGGKAIEAMAHARVDAAFEFFSKLGAPYYCFHDVDLAPDQNDLLSYERQLEHMVTLAKERQSETGVQLLWGIANLCTNPRYAQGAATSPNFDVLARAGAQVRSALDATIALDGLNYVFWNGREGYASLLNTNMKRERENLARLLRITRDYGRQQGFQGNFLIEPKPVEPMKQHYDVDAATVIAFLREFDLDDDYKLNIEANHATLAGHSFAHDVQVCIDANMLGSIDANYGNPQNGWDTVHFPLNVHENISVMLALLRSGGFKSGGLNLDAKLRRESTDAQDLFLAHIGGMDAFAHALLVAQALLDHSPLEHWRAQRYRSFDTSIGAQFARGELSLSQLHQFAQQGDLQSTSASQEAYENLINAYLYRNQSIG
jgi:xylose isomerase